MTSRLLGACLLSLSLGCGSTTVAPDGGMAAREPTPQEFFSPTSNIKKVTVEIDYGPQAAPYTGAAGAVNDTFTLFVTNVERLFKDSNKTLTIPRTLGEMEAITEAFPAQMTSQQILDTAKKHRDTLSTGDVGSVYILFVDALYQDDTGPRDDVLGVSIGTSGVIAIFKPVVESTKSTLLPNLVRFVEQTTLVHEFGHAIGLTNNGITPTTAHHDAAHGAHCSNQACVMYWQNEGSAAAIEFAKKYVTSGTTIVFGQDCLDDVDALKK